MWYQQDGTAPGVGAGWRSFFCFILVFELSRSANCTLVNAQQQTILVASSPFRMNLFPTNTALPSTSLRIVQQVALERLQETLQALFSQGVNRYYYVSEKTKLIFPEEEVFLAQNRSTSIPFFALATAANVTSFPPGTALEELRIQTANQRRNDLDRAIREALGNNNEEEQDDNEPSLFLESLHAKSGNTDLQNVTMVTIESLSAGTTVNDTISDTNHTTSQSSTNSAQENDLSTLDVALLSVSVAIFLGISLFLIQCLRDRRASVHNVQRNPPDDNESGDTIPVANPNKKKSSTPSKKQSADMASIFQDEETPDSRTMINLSPHKKNQSQFHSIDGFRANMHSLNHSATVATPPEALVEKVNTSVEPGKAGSNMVNEEEKTEIDRVSLDDHLPKNASAATYMKTDHLMDLVSIGTPELVNEDSEIFLFTDQVNSNSEGEMLPPEPPRYRTRYTTSTSRSITEEHEHYSETSSDTSSTKQGGNKNSIFRHDSSVSTSHDDIPFISTGKAGNRSLVEADVSVCASEHQDKGNFHCGTEAATRKKTASTEPASSSTSASRASSSSSSSQLSISATSTSTSSTLKSTTTAFSTCDATKKALYSASTSAAEVEPTVAASSVLNEFPNEVAGLLKAVFIGQANEASSVLRQTALPETLDETVNGDGQEDPESVVGKNYINENISSVVDKGSGLVDDEVPKIESETALSHFVETFESNFFGPSHLKTPMNNIDSNPCKEIVNDKKQANNSRSRHNSGCNEDILNVDVNSTSSKRKNKHAAPVAIAEWMKSIRVVSSASGGTGSKTSTTGSDVSSLTPSMGFYSYEQSMASSVEVKRKNLEDNANHIVDKAEL
jgi:hypothetical protein